VKPGLLGKDQIYSSEIGTNLLVVLVAGGNYLDAVLLGEVANCIGTLHR
jgi:hypothetical protein